MLGITMNTLITDKSISHIAHNYPLRNCHCHYFKETQPAEELEFEFGKSSSKTVGLQYHKILPQSITTAWGWRYGLEIQSKYCS